MRVLQTALACAAGTDRLARRGSLSLHAENLSSGDTRPSALGGALAWRRGETIFIARDPGEVSPPMTIGHRGEACWDGRYQISVDAPGRTTEFGVLDAEKALPPVTRGRLRTLPVPARMSQLACHARDGALVGLPALEPVAGVHVTDCVAHRLDHVRNLLAADLAV